MSVPGGARKVCESSENGVYASPVVMRHPLPLPHLFHNHCHRYPHSHCHGRHNLWANPVKNRPSPPPRTSSSSSSLSPSSLSSSSSFLCRSFERQPLLGADPHRSRPFYGNSPVFHNKHIFDNKNCFLSWNLENGLDNCFFFSTSGH